MALVDQLTIYIFRPFSDGNKSWLKLAQEDNDDDNDEDTDDDDMVNNISH